MEQTVISAKMYKIAVSVSKVSIKMEGIVLNVHFPVSTAPPLVALFQHALHVLEVMPLWMALVITVLILTPTV